MVRVLPSGSQPPGSASGQRSDYWGRASEWGGRAARGRTERTRSVTIISSVNNINNNNINIIISSVRTNISISITISYKEK